MTDDNKYLRGLLPPLPQKSSGLQGDIPLSALAQALASQPPTPRQLSLAEALEALGRTASPPLGLGALAQALESTEPTMRGLARFTAVPTPPPTMTNPFAASGIPVNPTPSPATLPDTRRKTFFSFHFDDSFRVNQVRKSGLIRPQRVGRMPVWWHDSSIYETSKRTDDAALRRLILNGLESTSVTCVLAGEQTWQREWVRFEIASSVKRRNALLTVYIHNLQCPNTGYGNPGPNPLDYMGVFIADDAKTYLAQRNAWGDWSAYDKITTPVFWPRYLSKLATRNWVQPLSAGTTAYDYDSQDGYQNLSIWVQDAAVAAGK